MPKKEILEDLATCHQQRKELDLHIEQAETLGRAMDIAIDIKNHLLVNELHKCLVVTKKLNTIHLKGLE